jgi:hypothetical protein
LDRHSEQQKACGLQDAIDATLGDLFRTQLALSFSLNHLDNYDNPISYDVAGFPNDSTFQVFQLKHPPSKDGGFKED